MASMDLDTYKKALEDKSEVPSFAPAVKTQYSRNITIEDWNSVISSVQGLLSDVSATSEFLMDNSAYQLQYSTSNVRGYYSIEEPYDANYLASDQLYFACHEDSIERLGHELYVAYGEGGHSSPLGVAMVGNRPYFVYTKTNSSPSNEVQEVGTGLVSYFYDENNKERVVYGTDNVTDGYGFFANVLDASGNYSGAISLGAKNINLETTEAVNGTHVYVFSADGNTTAIKSPMGSASVSLTNGEATITANKTTIALPSSSASINFGGLVSVGIYGTTFYGGNTFASSAPNCSVVPTYGYHLTNKAYVDSTAEAQATEKANAEQERAEIKENYLQTQINAINASQNFVATYAKKADMPTPPVSGLEDRDCVLVLKDEDHQDQAYVYKYDSAGWVEVGPLGDYYTKAQIDDMFTNDQHIFVSEDGFVCVDYDKLPVRA